MKTARFLLVALVAAAGCRVDALEGAEYAGPKNTCALSCPSESLCAEDACVAEQTTYPLALEATPPSTSPFAPGVTFTVNVEGRRGGNVPLTLPEPARVLARLEAGTTLPLVLRLVREGAVPGMASAVFEAKTLAKSMVPTTPPMSIPPGRYYVFVAPANDADLTAVPPVQLRNDETREPLVVTFGSGGNELRVAYGGSLRQFNVALVDDKGEPLVSQEEARDIYVVDLTTGRLASTIAHTCRVVGEKLSPEVTLVLAPELAGHRYALRIDTAERACSAAALPVRSMLEYDLQALDVEGRGGRVSLTMPRLVTTLARGRVSAYGKPTLPIEGKIVLRSVKLDQPSDQVTGRLSSVVTATVDRDGSFLTEAIPGTYRADIIPESDVRLDSKNYAICVDCTVPSQDPTAIPGTRVAEFRVSSSIRSVLAFEVPRRVQVRISAGGFDGSLFTVGTWEASSATSGLAFSAAGSPLRTRAQPGNVAEVLTSTGLRWNVDAALDPGLYDLIVRTHEDSGYPWIVLPRFEVQPRATMDVGLIRASAPVVITGTVVGADKEPVPRATVRARAHIVIDALQGPSGAVLVGETRADDAGRYRLVVPSVFATPAKQTPGAT